MASSFILFLKAVPELVGVIRQLGDVIVSAQNKMIDNKYEKLKSEMNEQIARISNASTNKDRQVIITNLNNLISRL